MKRIFEAVMTIVLTFILLIPTCLGLALYGLVIMLLVKLAFGG